MTTKRTAIAVTILSVFGVFCLVLAICFGVQLLILVARTGMAKEQVAIFFEMRDKALEAEPSEAVRSLEYTVNYYPSGMKQVPGSFLDSMVESVRAEMVRQMIDDLREKTDTDLGEDPEAWISRYGEER